MSQWFSPNGLVQTGSFGLVAKWAPHATLTMSSESEVDAPVIYLSTLNFGANVEILVFYGL